jgi:hypothetical protein
MLPAVDLGMSPPSYASPPILALSFCLSRAGGNLVNNLSSLRAQRGNLNR